MVEVYKIIVRNQRTKCQVQKYIYDTKKKFLIHGHELYVRKQNFTDYRGSPHACEIFRMDDRGAWARIEIPDHFNQPINGYKPNVTTQSDIKGEKEWPI